MQVMKKIIATSFIILLALFAISQDVNYAREIVNELSLSKYHGRGYVKNGDAKAAKYIAKQFKKYKLDNFNDSYFQKYSFPINSFPKKMMVSVDGQKLVTGIDYIVSLSAPSIKGEFKIDNITANSTSGDSLIMAMKSNNKNSIFLVNEKNSKAIYGKTIPNLVAAAVLTKNVPYWKASNGKKVVETTWLKIKSDKIPNIAKTISLNIENEFIDNYQTQNVVAVVKGSKTPNEYVVFIAHYDHLGMMGSKTYYPGANDNASGTAMVIDLARYYSLPQNKPECSIVFILASGEESGLNGSTYFAKNPFFSLEDIKLVVNFDMVGSGSDGIAVVNGNVYPELVKKMQTINTKNNYVKDVGSRGESCNSDHCPFYKKGVQAIFIYTRGKELREYHTITDTSENFPFTAYNGMFNLFTDLVKEL